jgi:hypothetical protein
MRLYIRIKSGQAQSQTCSEIGTEVRGDPGWLRVWNPRKVVRHSGDSRLSTLYQGPLKRVLRDHAARPVSRLISRATSTSCRLTLVRLSEQTCEAEAVRLHNALDWPILAWNNTGTIRGQTGRSLVFDIAFSETLGNVPSVPGFPSSSQKAGGTPALQEWDCREILRLHYSRSGVG